MAELSSNNPITANGDYDFNIRPTLVWGVSIAGTWGSGTAVLKYSDGTNWISYEDFSLTADGGKRVFVPEPGQLRVTLSGATSPSLTVAYTKEQP